MATFVIECPKCGSSVQAKTGLFASKTVKCACGAVIDVNAHKLATRHCNHCGNDVTVDLSAGGFKANCPVCGEAIDLQSGKTKVSEFLCAQCGTSLHSSDAAEHYTCPVCGHVNDVAERVRSQRIKEQGLASTIKYEGDNSTFVWKHPIEDFNLGSQLIVHESQEAVFFRDGEALDSFGPGRHTLETQQLPIFERLFSLPSDSSNTFHSEVYFVNLATQMGIRWGTDTKVRLFDPMSGLHLELGASGEFNIKVADARRLLVKVVGTTESLRRDDFLGTGDVKGAFRALVMTQVKSLLGQTIRENNISVLEIDEHLIELSDALRFQINKRLQEYGLAMTDFFVSRIATPDDDPNYRRVRAQFAEQYLGVRDEQIRRNVAQAEQERRAVEAQTEARVKIIAQQAEADALLIEQRAQAEAIRMKGLAEAEAYQAQATAEAAEMRMKGYTYQAETSRLVGMEAMQNGLTGGGSGEGGGSGFVGSLAGSMGDLAGLGVALGAMGGVMGMAKDAMSPMVNLGSQFGQEALAAPGGWDCACGSRGNTTRFCGSCGAKCPEPADVSALWQCPVCQVSGLTSAFCPHCGAKRPEPALPETWTCPDCQTQGNTLDFCPNCGKKRG